MVPVMHGWLRKPYVDGGVPMAVGGLNTCNTCLIFFSCAAYRWSSFDPVHVPVVRPKQLTNASCGSWIEINSIFCFSLN